MAKKIKAKLSATASVEKAGEEHGTTVAEAVQVKKVEPGTDPTPMIGRAHGTVEESSAAQQPKPDKAEAAAAAAAELTPTYKRISSAWQVAILPHWRQASKAEKKAFLKSIGVTPDLVS